MKRWTRAQVVMGTLVTLEVGPDLPMGVAHTAMEAALARMSHIARVMSAHDPGSDLGRLSRALPQQTLSLDPDTIRVLQAARDWTQRSEGLFDPWRAGLHLSRLGRRPGLSEGAGHWRDIEFLSSVEVHVAQAMTLDLGGIAKGYAVDQAMQVLREHGIPLARVNAGGDLAVMGPGPQPLTLRHAGDRPRNQDLGRLRLRQGALATSITPWSDWIPSNRRGRLRWRSATVCAPDCMTADALTKWALQSSLLCPVLQRTLRQHQAIMWRSP